MFRVFCECIVKYIDILGRKGCSRTALEYCKLLLGFSPTTDAYGVLLRMDFYSVRAHNEQFFLDFLTQFPVEVYQDPSATLLVLPNLLMSAGLAKQRLSQAPEGFVPSLNRTLADLMNMYSPYCG
jgi:hypothetical protein